MSTMTWCECDYLKGGQIGNSLCVDKETPAMANVHHIFYTKCRSMVEKLSSAN